ncbi:MAG: hypothetical protein Q4C69_00550 [Lachnoclostridium edouardi]|uniref:phage tail assembly chaperone n=1 Tax=Lachnoclostridium edouardi TaxID=1926283 RepID=UPI0026DC226B|nr:hypothetical protein [Lachnoclostridium edouardi]MDO4277289.1 hypothetical protein [Lachnoclostridium edouardi]
MSEKNVENQVQEVEFTEEQVKNQIRMSEKEMLAGLLEAAEFVEGEETLIQVKRKGKQYFSFSIRPLSEAEYNTCRKKHTKYLRNKQFGMKMPEETDTVRYRAALIYKATVEKDRKLLWDNKEVWKSLGDKGLDVVTGLDVIDFVLLAGEKDKIIETIDSISGFDTDSNLEEVAKN